MCILLKSKDKQEMCNLRVLTLSKINCMSVIAIGNQELIEKNLFGLFCSMKCPGELILRTYDFAHNFSNPKVSVISGFHSPMEEEALRFLLKGNSH